MGEKENIETLEIYEFIKDYLPLIPILRLKKGQFLFRADYKDPTLFYIVSGTIKVETVSRNGKKMLVDIAGRDEFMGAISMIHGANFQCSGIASTSVTVLALKKSLMDELIETDEFSVFFYQKTSKRVYGMYKKILARSLFSLKEIVAYYILENSTGDIFNYVSKYDMCEKLGASRRGIYNILHQFEEEGLIEKKDDVCWILDKGQIKREAKQVLDFMGEG